MDVPTTQVSLILRLRNPQDADAWEEFIQIYQIAIGQMVRKFGLSEADSADACQEILLRLSQVVNQWSPHSQNASFRGWLYRVARNTILRFLEQKAVESKTRNFESVEPFQIFQRDEEEKGSAFDLEFARQLLVFVTNKIKHDFDPRNWSAFWLTYVEQESIADAAAQLQINKSQIYVARSRILSRLREEVARRTSLDLSNLQGSMVSPKQSSLIEQSKS